MYITWSDRENVIRSGGFDILKNLPHFLLVLLIIQRFDLARWGFFTEFTESPVVAENSGKRILRATLEVNNVIYIYPYDDPIYGGVNLVGRSTSAAGARREPGPDSNTSNSQMIRDGNDLAVKFSWPRKSRESEVKFIEKAKEIGQSNNLVKDHIPTVVGHLEPAYFTCSTRPIRQFLGLDFTGERVLRVIAFRRLLEIKFLDEEDMLIAFLDCFFCRFPQQFLRYRMALIL